PGFPYEPPTILSNHRSMAELDRLQIARVGPSKLVSLSDVDQQCACACQSRCVRARQSGRTVRCTDEIPRTGEHVAGGRRLNGTNHLPPQPFLRLMAART